MNRAELSIGKRVLTLACAVGTLNIGYVQADIVRYDLFIHPIGDPSPPTLSGRHLYSTIFPGGGLAPGATDIELEYNTDTNQIEYAEFSDFGDEVAYLLGFQNHILNTLGLGDNRTLFYGAATMSEVQLILEGDLDRGGFIRIVPFDLTATDMSGRTILDRDLSTLRFLEAPVYGTMFLNLFFKFLGGVEFGGPTAASVAPPGSGMEYVLYAPPIACNQADLEADGVLDLSDINAFTSGFVSQAAIADLNSDGVFDLVDIGVFIDAFLVGCP